MAKKKPAKRSAKEKAQAVGREVMQEAGDAIRWMNDDFLPEPLSYVNPLTIFEDSPEAQSVRQGLSFGWSDELAGILGGEGEQERARDEIDAFRSERPITSMVGETAGALALPGGSVRGLGGLLRLRGMAPVAYGAAGGGLYGAGVGDDEEKLKSALIGGGFGAASGGLGSFLLTPKINQLYRDKLGRFIARADPDLDIFIDPQSIPRGVLYHTTPASRAESIRREGIRLNRSPMIGGPDGQDFAYLSQSSTTPGIREMIKTMATQMGEKRPVTTFEIDARKLAAGRLMADRFNVPRRGLIDVSQAGTEVPANAHKLFQYAADIPPEAILRVVPEEELSALAAGARDRASLAALHRAKAGRTRLGRDPEAAVETMSPDEALAALKKAEKRAERRR